MSQSHIFESIRSNFLFVVCGGLLGGVFLISLAAEDKCNVDVSERRDCGYFGITQNECKAKGCCWRPAAPGQQWCFYHGNPGAKCGNLSSNLLKPGEAPFNDTQLEKIKGYFLANIDIEGSGAVVAAPDHDTPGGNYYYHWERDGALTMHTLQRTAETLEAIEGKLKNYVTWVEKVQNQPDPHSIDIRTEPKYTIPDGKPYSGYWCRPQNDGPGLRAKTLTEFGLALLERGKPGDLDFVKEHLWTGTDQKHGGIVKYDLNWQAANWRSNGCDLWEEVRSDDFFWNRFTMRISLITGAKLASRMGDVATASKYQQVAKDVEATLMSHYDGQYVYESRNRLKDAVVIEAFNVGYLDDELFAPLSKEVLGTVVTLNDLFCNSFPVNKLDEQANVPGILYGRYEGDDYNGGNPWVLLTASLAQLIYRQAAACLKAELVSVDTYSLLQKAYDINTGLEGRSLGDALMSVADGVLVRIKHHVKQTNFHMAEQIDRNDGHMTGAEDLTWNYADILKAMHARKEYMKIRAATKASVQQVLV